MNLALMTIKMMLNTTGSWLDEDEGIGKALTDSGPLGVGVLEELGDAHVYLAGVNDKREQLHAELRALIDRITKLDETHDSKARGLNYALKALIEIADSEEEAEPFVALERRLFPIGLRVIRLPFVEEGGAAEQLDRTVGPEIRAQLADIKIGKRTLEQVFVEWIEAGQALGKAVNRRERLRASLKRDGSAAEMIDITGGCKRWRQAVGGLLWAIETKPKLAPLSEPVEAALHGAIELSRKRRRDAEGGGAGEGQEQLVEDDELDEDEDEDEDEGLDEDEEIEGLDDDGAQSEDGEDGDGEDDELPAPD